MSRPPRDLLPGVAPPSPPPCLPPRPAETARKDDLPAETTGELLYALTPFFAWVAAVLVALALGAWFVAEARDDQRIHAQMETEAAERLAAQPPMTQSDRNEAERIGKRLTELIYRGPTGLLFASNETRRPLHEQRARLAGLLGINRYDLQYMEDGERLLSHAEIRRICEIYGVSEAWFNGIPEREAE